MTHMLKVMRFFFNNAAKKFRENVPQVDFLTLFSSRELKSVEKVYLVDVWHILHDNKNVIKDFYL